MAVRHILFQNAVYESRGYNHPHRMDTLHRSLTEYTDTMSMRVPPLQHLARLCVRKNILNIKFRQNVQSLPLPDKLKEYVLYSDCPLLTWEGDSLWLGTEPLFINGAV